MNLILVRHGEYDKASGNLNKSGICQAELLSEKISKITNESIVVFSSGVKRADETAEILVRKLGIKSGAKILNILNYQPDSLTKKRFRKIKRTILNLCKSYENIILITHLGVVSDFPGMFAQKEWGRGMKRQCIKKGSAVLISLEDKDFFIITPK
jgi:phosphohistidine phosphatase SixA